MILNKFMSEKKTIILFMLILVTISSCQTSIAQDTTESTTQTGLTKAPLEGRAVIIDIKSDKLDFFEDRNELVATGSAAVEIKEQNSKLEADKITFNQDTQLVIAENNVKLTKNGKVVHGSFARIDLTKESALIDNPEAQINQIKINAKTANVYTKNMEALKGNAVIVKQDLNMKLSTNDEVENGANVLVPEENKFTFGKQNYKIFAKDIQVDLKPDINIITLKNATITIKKIKIASIPYLQLSTDEEGKRIETMLPEVGSNREMGAYIGPGYVFYLPKGSTFKVAPLFAFNKSDIGFGGLGRLTTSTNTTQVGFTSIKDKLVIKGEQELSPFTKIAYGNNTYMENGIFGSNRVGKLIEIVDDRQLGSAGNIDLFLRSSAGYAQNYENDWSSTRFQLQGTATTRKPLYNFHNGLFTIGGLAQSNISVYGNGSTAGVLRGGPKISSMFGPVYVGASYLQGAVYGSSPFDFDKNRQGKSLVYTYGRLDITRNVSIGNFMSMNLLKDGWENKFLTENQFYVSFGPDDVKFRITYDTIRKRSQVSMDLLMGSERNAIDFDRLKVNDYRQ